jgi:transposase
MFMPRKSNKSPLILSDHDRNMLEVLSRSKTASMREVQRARILLGYSNGKSITQISEDTHTSRDTVYKWIEKAVALGIQEGTKDTYHKPKEPTITEEAKNYVIHLACKKPKELEYAAELWTLSALSEHIRNNSPFTCLKRIVKSTVYTILKEHALQPHKLTYYLEKKDPEFEKKMIEVLMVYKEVNLIREGKLASSTITVSVDEKPGVQAIQNTAQDLPPVANKYSRTARDYEYKRLGTVSILAALNLHNGTVQCTVEDRHRSQEFIRLLELLDKTYPADNLIRIILDNHSAHISKETMAYLKSKPNRFQYIHTPKHGSWLNIVETLFSKMSRTFLKHIRVNSIEELKERINKGVNEINQNPVIHKWGKFEELGVI